MTLPRLFLPAVVIAIFACAATAQEKLPVNVKIVKLEATPSCFELVNPFDYRQLRIDATLDNGDVIDVTRIARIAPSADLVKVSPSGFVRPVADGKGELHIDRRRSIDRRFR